MATSPSIPSTMKAWQFTSVAGGMEKNLTLNKAAALPSSAPNLAPDSTLVQVLAMALNPVDYKFFELPVAGRFVAATPASPGIDYCGRVVSTGSSLSSTLKPGQLVFGRLDSPTQFGTLAEYIVTPKAGTIPLPQGVKPADAASIGTAGSTAYQCIAPNVKSGDNVFINGGSGGTGTYGIQIAKAIGCRVTASCSTPNVKLCKELGADEVLDYTTGSVTKQLKAKGATFDLVVDNVGVPSDLYSESHHFLKSTGKYVQVGVEMSVGGMMGAMSRMVRPGFLGGGKRQYQFLGCANKAEDFIQLSKWMQEGKVKAITEVFTFEEAVQAYEKMKTGRTKGKIVVEVSQ